LSPEQQPPSPEPASTPADEASPPSPDAETSPDATQEGAEREDPLRRSRTSVLWLATIGLGLVLILLVVLILQNTQQVKVSFLWWEGTPPLAAALLIAAAAGILLTAIAGSLRILQLRRRVKRR
jgi:uncharacterized integral membrane protein